MPRMVASGAHLARIADFTRAYQSCRGTRGARRNRRRAVADR